MKKILIYLVTVSCLILLTGILHAAKLGSIPSNKGRTSCGETIYTDITLTEDLIDCPGNGLIIGADNIHLDCDNHIIDGTGTGSGIILDNRKNCMIEDCKIKEFEKGIFIDKVDPGYDDNYIIRNVIEDNTHTGLYIQASNRNNIYYNVFQHNSEYNAYETENAIGNHWYSGFFIGNSWGDLYENPCWPTDYYYCIDGPGGGIDYYPSVVDQDGDGIPDDDDNCPLTYNPRQWDCDEDGIGDVCDEDAIDEDNDRVDDACDNCLGVPNNEQVDEDADTHGYPCDCHDQDPYINPETVDHCMGRWNYVNFFGTGVGEIEFAQTNPDLMYVGTGKGLWRSTDGGETWEQIINEYLTEESSINSIAISPIDENTVYVGAGEPANGGILYTHDGGQTWGFTYFGFPFYTAASIQIPQAGAPVYLLIKGYIYRSWNDFVDFEDVSPSLSVGMLAIDPLDHNYIIAADSKPVDGPVFLSTDAGLSWDLYYNGVGNWHDIQIIPGHQKAYIGAHCEGMWRLDNFTLPLLEKNNELTNTCILSLGLNKVKPEIVYAGTGYSYKGFFRTDNEAENWYEMSDGLRGSARRVGGEIESHPVHSNIVFAGTSKGLFKHYNAGKEFENHFRVGNDQTCNQPGGCVGEDPSDEADCDFQNNCVWQGQCYMGRKSGELAVVEIDGSSNLGVCVGHSWWDPDTYEPGLELCEEADWSYDLPGCEGADCYVPSAEPNVGEYPYQGALGCCGDDEGEVFSGGMCWSAKRKVKKKSEVKLK